MKDLVESVLRFESYFLLMMLIMFGYLYEYSIQRLFNLIQSIKNHSAMTLIVNRKLLSFTPLRTLGISGLKSQILKPPFLS